MSESRVKSFSSAFKNNLKLYRERVLHQPIRLSEQLKYKSTTPLDRRVTLRAEAIGSEMPGSFTDRGKCKIQSIQPRSFMTLRNIAESGAELHTEAIALDRALAQEIQNLLIWFGLLEPPSDGKFGPISAAALQEFQKLADCDEAWLGKNTARKLLELKSLPTMEIRLGNDLAGRIVKYMLERNYFVARGKERYNIVYLEGADEKGNPNNDAPNQFNDRRMIIEIPAGIPIIVGNWEGSTEPGTYYTDRPMNPKGAARIAFGQYKAWRVGTHGNSEPHEALVQRGIIKVHRDKNKDGLRTGDAIDVGDEFAVNQHWGYDLPRTNIANASAGCLVGRTRAGHREFMQINKTDRRYRANKAYMFPTTVIPADDLARRSG